MPETLENPHHPDALTADTIRPGTYFACWQVKGGCPAKYYTAVSTPYSDDEGYRLIQVRDKEGRVLDISTGDVGLTPTPHGDGWIAIAINMDSAEFPG